LNRPPSVASHLRFSRPDFRERCRDRQKSNGADCHRTHPTPDLRAGPGHPHGRIAIFPLERGLRAAAADESGRVLQHLPGRTLRSSRRSYRILMFRKRAVMFAAGCALPCIGAMRVCIPGGIRMPLIRSNQLPLLVMAALACLAGQAVLKKLRLTAWNCFR